MVPRSSVDREFVYIDFVFVFLSCWCFLLSSCFCRVASSFSLLASFVLLLPLLSLLLLCCFFLLSSWLHLGLHLGPSWLHLGLLLAPSWAPKASPSSPRLNQNVPRGAHRPPEALRAKIMKIWAHRLAPS